MSNFGRSKKLKHKNSLKNMEIDHTKPDLFVVDGDTGMPVGKPYFIAAIDTRTKLVSSFYVSLNPPNHLSIYKLLYSLRSNQKMK